MLFLHNFNQKLFITSSLDTQNRYRLMGKINVNTSGSDIWFLVILCLKNKRFNVFLCSRGIKIFLNLKVELSSLFLS